MIVDEFPQFSFMPEQAKAQNHEKLETAIDGIRSRFGHFAVQRGIMLTDQTLSKLDPKNDHVIHPVGFQK